MHVLCLLKSGNVILKKKNANVILINKNSNIILNGTFLMCVSIKFFSSFLLDFVSSVVKVNKFDQEYHISNQLFLI